MLRPLVNNRIIAKEVRLIDADGVNLGTVSFVAAITKARERGLDLVQVTEKVTPPVCRVMEYGKYLYELQKKEKKARLYQAELKGIRLSFNISSHDMEVRIKAAEKFLAQGHPVKVEMRLRGREKALGDFARGKFQQFLTMLKAKQPIKVERELKREPRGFTMVVSKI